MDNSQLRQFLNKQVVVTNSVGGGLYKGKLVGFKPDKFAISNLLIINQAGGLTSPKYERTRWFTSAKCTVKDDPDYLVIQE